MEEYEGAGWDILEPEHELGLTNLEVTLMFHSMVAAALAQIAEKQYEASLVAKGIPKERIRKYGFAFQGKKVLIG